MLTAKASVPRHRGRKLKTPVNSVELRAPFDDLRFQRHLWWKDSTISKAFVEKLGAALGIKRYEDWYSVKRQHFEQYGGLKLIRAHQGLVSNVITHTYPEHKWEVWKFERVPIKFWASIENQRDFILSAEKELGIKSCDEWYNIKKEALFALNGTGLLRQYNYNVPSMLQSVLPERNWVLWRFPSIPEEFWSNPINIRNFLEWAYKQLNYTSLEDFHKLSTRTIQSLGASGLCRRYKHTYEIVKLGYPEHEWLPWKFTFCPRGWWIDKSNQLTYMEWLRAKLNLNKSLEDLYRLRHDDLVQNYGVSLLALYDYSPISIVTSLYEDYEWLPWKFTQTPQGFWKQIENQKKFMDWLGKKLNFKSLEDFYTLKNSDIADAGGGGLLAHYNTSVLRILTNVYPEHTWHPWKFGKAMNSWWRKVDNQRQYIEWLRKELNLVRMEDLYELSNTTFINYKGAALLTIYEGASNAPVVYKILKACYPDHYWDPLGFKVRQARQNILAEVLQKECPQFCTGSIPFASDMQI